MRYGWHRCLLIQAILFNAISFIVYTSGKQTLCDNGTITKLYLLDWGTRRIMFVDYTICDCNCVFLIQATAATGCIECKTNFSFHSMEYVYNEFKTNRKSALFPS